MDWVFGISFDTLVMSAIACLLIREALIAALPDRIAGPGGWFIDTGLDTGTAPGIGSGRDATRD